MIPDLNFIGDFYKNRRVLVTGNTGFKGSWLTRWLSMLGAEVSGYSLRPPSKPSLYEVLQLDKHCVQYHADVRDFYQLWRVLNTVKPEIIFHLAAQSLVRESYDQPLETFHTNTVGSVNLLEAVRRSGLSVCVVMITSDKCYDNPGHGYSYRENDPMGGFDPYSCSKGVAELAISSWRNSFFDHHVPGAPDVRVASARAGNVIGGGDWARDRIVPDCINGLISRGSIQVRNPNHTRPWQHVVEPLYGYLLLGAKLLSSPPEDVNRFTQAFNFGPQVTSNRTVGELVQSIVQEWGSGSWFHHAPEIEHHESALLNLNSDKAYHFLRWFPVWNFQESIHNTVDWYRTYHKDPEQAALLTTEQISSYIEKVRTAADSEYHPQPQKLETFY